MIVYDPKRTVPNWAPGAWQCLERLLSKDDYCFEWGGGQSTKWLADRVGFVLTVENKVDWAVRTLELTKECRNCHLLLASRLTPRYVNSVDFMSGLFNVYLIDGFQRINCLTKTMEIVKPGDIIVLDDALDYAADTEFLATIERFRMPHPYAGKPVTPSDHGNTKLTVHAEFKETWIVEMQ